MNPPGIAQRLMAVIGTVLCAFALGLGAYAAHAVTGVAQSRLELASLYLFFHGLALAVFALRHEGRLAAASSILWLVGCLAFCGSLIGAALLGTSTALAPVGGSAFMLGWLLRGAAIWRASPR